MLLLNEQVNSLIKETINSSNQLQVDLSNLEVKFTLRNSQIQKSGTLIHNTVNNIVGGAK